MAVCSACGSELPPAARYCSSCGARTEEPSRAHEERKVVTILFVDLVGSTSQADRRDPEDVPERAVRAALEGRRTIARLNEERGLNLSVRISVATGEALIDLRALEE